MAFIHKILNAGDKSHNGTVRKQRKPLPVGLNAPRREAGMSSPVWEWRWLWDAAKHHTEAQKEKALFTCGKEETPQGQKLRRRELLRQIATSGELGNAFSGDRLCSETRVMMGW